MRLECALLAVTMPVDVVKTRLQMDGSGGAVKQYSGSMDCAGKLVKSEGPGALFKGLPPALVRQSTYGSLRYGLYGPIKNSMGIKAGEPVPLWKKIIAGGGAGAIASAVANPTDLIKVRLQTDGMAKDAEGNLLPKRYTGMINCFTTTVKEEGVLALWTGVGPTVGRATALAAAELATYDEVKQRLLATGWFQPGLLLTVTTAFASGYVSTVASSPFDVVKSRVMGQPLNPDGTGKVRLRAPAEWA
jgi:solute carrier family 25 uncoupling protein 8/9